ncbi:carbohydrate kinase family protein [Sphaerisporangium sp. B11E5]|uniref:carbohydrate kinase family protein n=1 Tax=Sphaerisporangium sp. B11E5 TaxID=3153563 RepID=UPI00325EB1E8
MEVAAGPGGAVYDVVVVGGAGVDTTVYVPGLPLPYADTYTVPPAVDRIGNTGSGVVLGCHALGLRTILIDLVGDDPQGALVRGHLTARGIEFAFGTVPEGTRRSVLLVAPDGRRTSLFDPRHVPGRRLPRDLYLPAVRRARHVHLSITDFSRHLFPDLHALGVPTSTDLHDWDGENPYHRDFARHADIVFLSAARLTDPPATMRDILAGGRATQVICTAGASGAYLLTRTTPLVHRPAAVPKSPVVDTNGAGDAFASAYLYAHLHGLPAERALHLATLAGAHACTTPGTHENPVDERTLLAQE